MPVLCVHYSDGKCTIGEMGGNPTMGYCVYRCDKFVGSHPGVKNQKQRGVLLPTLPTPLQISAQPHGKQVKILKPGNLVEWMIQAANFKAVDCAGCAAFKKQMNAWGWWGCWKNRNQIVAWFVAQGAKAGIKIPFQNAMGLLFAAFGEIWRKNKRMKLTTPERAPAKAIE